VIVNIVLWVAGVALLAIGILRVRAPYARMSELDRLADNSRRYESWRGNRLENEGISGADVMRALLRRQVIRWAVACAVGVVLIVAGFAIR
jgi:hypothetical protein